MQDKLMRDPLEFLRESNARRDLSLRFNECEQSILRLFYDERLKVRRGLVPLSGGPLSS